jgi:hypothetical protein
MLVWLFLILIDLFGGSYVHLDIIIACALAAAAIFKIASISLHRHCTLFTGGRNVQDGVCLNIKGDGSPLRRPR